MAHEDQQSCYIKEWKTLSGIKIYLLLLVYLLSAKVAVLCYT